MNASPPTQIFALLFQADGTVRVGAETAPSVRELSAPNTEQGLSCVLEWMAEHFDSNLQPLLCCCAVEGAAVGGHIFEELVASDQVRRFLMAQPFYLKYAEDTGQDPSLVATLLRAARKHAPGVCSAA